MGFHGAFSNVFARAISATVSAAANFLLRDEFTTNQAAPLTSPRTAEPGPGTETITDTGNKMSISSGLISWTGRTATHNPRVVSEDTYTRTTGLCAMQSTGATRSTTFGFTSSPTLDPAIGNGGLLEASNWHIGTVSISTASGAYIHGVVLRSSGCFYLRRPTSGSDYTLWYVASTMTTTPVYARFGTLYNNTASSVDFFYVMQLQSPWSTDYGVATNRTSSPVQGDTLTCEANTNGEVTWNVNRIYFSADANRIDTLVNDVVKNSYSSASFNNTATTMKILTHTSDLFELAVRYTDDNNCWIIRCDRLGSTIKLIERNAGVETERSSAAQSWSTGAISEFIAWPRVLSGAALAELQRWIP